jgi:hypothetical protein
LDQAPAAATPRLAAVAVGSWKLEEEEAHDEGRQKKNPEKTTYICASSQKKVRTYLLLFFFFFSAFLGVSRQGEFENTRKKIEYVSKKITGEIFFRGGIFFPGDFF